MRQRSQCWRNIVWMSVPPLRVTLPQHSHNIAWTLSQCWPTSNIGILVEIQCWYKVHTTLSGRPHNIAESFKSIYFWMLPQRWDRRWDSLGTNPVIMLPQRWGVSWVGDPHSNEGEKTWNEEKLGSGCLNDLPMFPQLVSIWCLTLMSKSTFQCMNPHQKFSKAQLLLRQVALLKLGLHWTHIQTGRSHTILKSLMQFMVHSKMGIFPVYIPLRIWTGDWL